MAEGPSCRACVHAFPCTGEDDVLGPGRPLALASSQRTVIAIGSAPRTCVTSPPVAHRGAGITAPTRTQAAVPDATLAHPAASRAIFKGR